MANTRRGGPLFILRHSLFSSLPILPTYLTCYLPTYLPTSDQLRLTPTTVCLSPLFLSVSLSLPGRVARDPRPRVSLVEVIGWLETRTCPRHVHLWLGSVRFRSVRPLQVQSRYRIIFPFTAYSVYMYHARPVARRRVPVSRYRRGDATGRDASFGFSRS